MDIYSYFKVMQISSKQDQNLQLVLQFKMVKNKIYNSYCVIKLTELFILVNNYLSLRSKLADISISLK